MKTTIKILLLVTIMAIGMIVVGWTALSGLEKVNILAHNTNNSEVPGMIAVTEVSTSVQHITRIEKNMILETDPLKMPPYKANLEKEYQKLNTGLEHLEQYFFRPEGKALVKKVMAATNRWMLEHKQVIEYAQRSDIKENYEKARDLSMTEARADIEVLEKELDELTAFKLAALKNTATETSETFSSVRTTMYITLALVILLGCAIGWMFARSIMRQLGDEPAAIAALAEKIASGDLNTNFNPAINFGVYSAIRRMAENLKAKIGEAEEQTRIAAQGTEMARKATEEAQAARRAAENARREGMLAAAGQLEGVVERMTSAAEELSAQVEESSRGASVQKNRVGETATAMEEMNATVLEVASNAATAADLSSKAKEKALEGASTVSSVVSAIGQVQTLATNLKTEMEGLGKQAEDIGQVMNVISDIADQTNLLALNAAIEAARAGEAGRGFAVVADEVRKLAEKTMHATKQVGEAISGIQQGARRSMGSMDNSVKSIVDTTELARNSGQALTEIVKLVETASDQVRSIATASEEQSAASEEITRGMEQINNVSDELAETMGQSALAVSEVAQQSQAIQRIIMEMKKA